MPALVALVSLGLPLLVVVVLYRKRMKVQEGDEETLMELEFVIGDYRKVSIIQCGFCDRSKRSTWECGYAPIL